MVPDRPNHSFVWFVVYGFPLDPELQPKQTGHLRQLIPAERPHWMYVIQIRVLDVKIRQNIIIWSESSVFDLNSPEWTEPACLVRGWRDEEIVGERETAGETEGFPALGSWVSSEVSSVFKCVCLSVYLQSLSSVRRGVNPHWLTVSLSLVQRVGTHQSSAPCTHTYFPRRKHAYQLTTGIKETTRGSLTNNLFFLSFSLKSQWFVASEEKCTRETLI